MSGDIDINRENCNFSIFCGDDIGGCVGSDESYQDLMIENPAACPFRP